jgi:hypothetical protein
MKGRRDHGAFQTSFYVPYNRSGEKGPRPSGKLVGIISVQPNDFKPGDFNPLVLFLSVNKRRKDFAKVIEQIDQIKKAQLPKYEKALFDSCFKNW